MQCIISKVAQNVREIVDLFKRTLLNPFVDICMGEGAIRGEVGNILGGNFI